MPYQPIDCCQGLHQIQSSVNQLSYMGEHSSQLLKHLNVILEITYAMSPKRNGGYRLERVEGERPSKRQQERLLEKAIWRKWRHSETHTNTNPTGHFIQDHCSHIQTYQMPLQNKRLDQSWGKVDLVGVSLKGTPTVFELKQESANDTPLRMLVEGLAYAVAIRRAWNEGHLREQWLQSVSPKLDESVVPTTLLTVPVFGIAPKEFWERRAGKGDGKRTVKKAAWSPFHQLCEACKDRGFPISFLQFSSQGYDEGGFPLIEGVSTVRLPC